MDTADRDALVAALAAAPAPGAETMRAATAAVADLAPVVIERLEAAARGAFPLPHEARLIESGLFVLAAAGRSEAMPAFLRFLTRAARAADYTLGWEIADSASAITIALFDGDIDTLMAAIADPEIEEFGCWGLLQAVAELAHAGRIPREAALAMLERFDRERLHPEESFAWEGWRSAVLSLGDPALGQRLLASLEDGRAPPREPDLLDWRERGERLQRGALRPDDIDQPPSIERILARMTETPVGQEEGEGEDASDDDASAATRADPAGDLALGEEDFAWLDAFLASVPTAHASPTVAWLDGFLTALAAGPVTVSDDALVEDLLDQPDLPWPDALAPARAHAGALLRRHYKAIDRRLAAERGLMPLTEPGDDRAFQSWSEGFMRFVEFAEAQWQPIIRHRQMRTVLNPIILAATGKSDHYRGAPPTEVDEIAADIAAGMYALREYCGGKIPDPRVVPPRTEPKIGRNEACPCGSGKKYKKCCGKAA